MRSILACAVLALSACSGSPPPLPPPCGAAPTQHLDITISQASPPVQLRIDGCRVDSDACPDLCAAVMSVDNIQGTLSSCDVTFDSEHTYVSIDSQSGCALPENGGDL